MNRSIAIVAVVVCALSGICRAADNELSDQEKKDGWILMFDGKSLDGELGLALMLSLEGTLKWRFLLLWSRSGFRR